MTKTKFKKMKLTLMNDNSVIGSEKINCRKKYLVKYDGEKYHAYFSREWYGLSFCDIDPAGISLHNLLEMGGRVYEEVTKLKTKRGDN